MVWLFTDVCEEQEVNLCFDNSDFNSTHTITYSDLGRCVVSVCDASRAEQQQQHRSAHVYGDAPACLSIIWFPHSLLPPRG